MTGPWFAQVAPGLETVLIAELADLGLRGTSEAGGAVIDGDIDAGWTVLVRSRVAAGLLFRVGTFRAGDAAGVAAGARGLDWAPRTHPRQELRVSATCRNTRMRAQAVEGAVRRGIAERLRGPRLPGGRPPRNAADVLVRVDGDRVTVSLDVAGEPLHRRGWRLATAKAPLRENLAAAVLRTAGWRPGVPLVDPMCGSGTFPIEAGCWTAGIWPGARRRFAIEDWPSHDAKAWARFRASRAERGPSAVILGSDRVAGAVAAARDNLGRSGAGRFVDLRQADLRELAPPAGSGVLVANPPWGQRIGGDDPRPVWRILGATCRERWTGWTVAVVGPDELPRATGLPLRPAARFPAGGIPVAVWVGSVP